MKFLIKSLGWDALARGVRARARRRARRGRRAAAVRSRAIRRSTRRAGLDAAAAPSVGEIAARVDAGTVDGPGHRPDRRRRSTAAGRRAYASGARRTSGRRSSSAIVMVDRHAAARRPHQRADARARRSRARLRRRHGPRHDRSESGVPLGRQSATCAGLYRRLAAAGLGAGRTRARSPTSTSCPGAESCRLAVTQSRGLGRLLEDHLRARPDLIARRRRTRASRSAAARTAAASITSPTIGFQGSVRKLGDRRRAAVLRDGRRRRRPDGGELRPAGGEDSGAPHSRSGRAADAPLRGRAHDRRDGARLLPARRSGARARGARRSRAADGGGRGAGRLHRSRRGSRVQPGGDGRRMQRPEARRTAGNRRAGIDRQSRARARHAWARGGAVSEGARHPGRIARWAGPAELPISATARSAGRTGSSTAFDALPPEPAPARRRSTSRCAARFRCAAGLAAAPRRRSPGSGCASSSTAGVTGTKSSMRRRRSKGIRQCGGGASSAA